MSARGRLLASRPPGATMISDSLLFDAGSVFFAAWGLVIAAVSVAAFGRELLPAKASNDPVRKINSSSTAGRMKP